MLEENLSIHFAQINLHNFLPQRFRNVCYSVMLKLVHIECIRPYFLLTRSMKFLEFHENRAYSNETKLQTFYSITYFLMKITDIHFRLLFIWVTVRRRNQTKQRRHMVYIIFGEWVETEKEKS